MRVPLGWTRPARPRRKGLSYYIFNSFSRFVDGRQRPISLKNSIETDCPHRPGADAFHAFLVNFY